MSFAFSDLYQARLPLSVQIVLLSAFGLSFAIKVPLVPLHTWLPDAHVEAPTAGSVILAGILLKMGTYGFMKLGFPLFPDATHWMMPFLITLSVVSIVYGACLALVQDDIKKIIAYSSISHLGYVMLGLVSLDLIGVQGAIVQMVSHGLTAAGLFLLVGMIYERCHTRDLAAYGGLAKLLPVYAVFCMLLTLASIGLPTTSGFTGEFMVLLGAGTAGWQAIRAGQRVPAAMSAGAVSGVVLGALYMLRFAQGFLFGAAKAPHAPVVDLDLREKLILGAIIVAIFALGLFPNEPLSQDRARRAGVSGSSCRRRACRRFAMKLDRAPVALAPENILLAGMVVRELSRCEIFAPESCCCSARLLCRVARSLTVGRWRWSPRVRAVRVLLAAGIRRAVPGRVLDGSAAARSRRRRSWR